MNRVEKIKCNLVARMKTLRVSQHMLAKLLNTHQASIGQWKKAGKIPIKHLAALNAITPKQAATVQKWADYDLHTLREELCITHTELAELLFTSTTMLTAWKRRKRIPRNRLHLVQKLQCQIKNNSY